MLFSLEKRCSNFNNIPINRSLKRDRFFYALLDRFRESKRVRGLVFGVWCTVFWVWGLAFGVWRLVFGVWCLEFGVWCLWFRVCFFWNLELGAWDSFYLLNSSPPKLIDSLTTHHLASSSQYPHDFVNKYDKKALQKVCIFL